MVRRVHDRTGESVYIAIEPSHQVISGPCSPKVLAVSILLAMVFSMLSFVPVALLLGSSVFACAVLAMLPVYFLLCMSCLGDYPDIPIIRIAPCKSRWIGPRSWLRLYAISVRVGQMSVSAYEALEAIQKVIVYLDARPKRQTAILFIASEKAWAKHSSFLSEFIKQVGQKFPSAGLGYLGTMNEVDRLSTGVCRIPFESTRTLKDLLWYLAEASITSNENGVILHELFSSNCCIAYFAPRPFRGLRWKGRFTQFDPFTPETAIRWVEALVDRYSLFNTRHHASRAHVILRLPRGDSIPLTSAIVEEVRRRLGVKPRMYEVSEPLSGVRRGIPQVILCAATDWLEGGENA